MVQCGLDLMILKTTHFRIGIKQMLTIQKVKHYDVPLPLALHIFNIC